MKKKLYILSSTYPNNSYYLKRIQFLSTYYSVEVISLWDSKMPSLFNHSLDLHYKKIKNYMKEKNYKKIRKALYSFLFISKVKKEIKEQISLLSSKDTIFLVIDKEILPLLPNLFYYVDIPEIEHSNTVSHLPIYFPTSKKKEGNDFTIEIITSNDSSYKKDLKNYITSFFPQYKVHFINNENYIFSESSVCWMIDEKYLSTIINELKYNRIPLLTLRCSSSINQQLEDGETGFITQSEKELITLTNDLFVNPSLYKKLSLASYEEYKKYTKKRVEKEWLSTLK